MPSTPGNLRHAPLKGIALILFAVVIFASMDTAGKYLMTKFNVPIVASVRYGVNLILLTALVMPKHGTSLWYTHNAKLVWLRGTCLAAATLFMGLALQRMPLGETVAIIYLQGFGVMLAAGYFLKERVTLAGWAAAIVGFAGVILIARPGGNLAPAGVGLALICAALSVVYILLSRSLAKTETTHAMLFYVAVVGFVIFAGMLPFNQLNYDFEWMDVALMIYLGAASLFGHFLHTSAYRFAPASLLAPFNYFHIAFAVLAGWLVYQHIPDFWALVGMAMIAISGAAIALHTHLKKA